MRDEPERVARVNAIGDRMRKGFRDLGFNAGESVSPIIPIILGDDDLTFLFWKRLFDSGVFVNPIISPATPPGYQLLRTSYMATHTDEQLDRVLDIFCTVGKEVGVIH
jgi:7-keto-8-aminopelargonate synthetase-like enzyme